MTRPAASGDATDQALRRVFRRSRAEASLPLVLASLVLLLAGTKP